jgi:helicase
MRILGLFVGVDRQQYDEIRVLAYAGRDAEALHAIFGDLAEDAGQADSDNVVLVGEEATRAGVLAALARLARESVEGDVGMVVIHFSCHGTPDGALILADTVSSQENATGLTYSALREALEAIRAPNIVVLLDCCFSGCAAGQRRFAGDGSKESLTLEALFQSMPLGNLAIVMGARANEQGWESSRLRHGIFSHAMVEALTGTAVRRVAGQISVAEWLRAGVAGTLAEASREGIIQTPMQRIGWAGDPRLPAPQGGHRQSRLRERDALRQVTDDVESLATYGLTSTLIAATGQMIEGGRLNPLQVRAINEGGALAGRNVLVAAPTSSGKTLIGYLAALACVARRGRAVVLVPTKALASEKWREFQHAFDDGRITAIRSFGGVDDDDPALRTNHYDVAFLTYEKFLALALTRPYVLDAVETMVVDEVHLIGDKGRGKTVEMLLTLVRHRASQGRRSQLVCLSASLDETNGFERWLAAKLIREDESTRPIPLLEGVISASGRYRFRNSRSAEEDVVQLFSAIPARFPNEYPDSIRMRVATATMTQLIANPLEHVLAFPWSKNRTRKLASTLAASLQLPSVAEALNALDGDGSGRDDSTTTRELLETLKHGVGFHTSDLDQEERSAIEGAFRTGNLRVLVATSGLAMGINTPATSVIVVDHTRYSGEEARLTIAEYKNMVGRAGRLQAGAAPGRTFLCATDDREADDLFAQYVLGKPEALQSQLVSLGEADATLALLALSGPASERDLIAAANQTFDGFQHSNSAEWRMQRRDAIRAALEELRVSGYIAPDDKAMVFRLTDAGRVLSRSSLSTNSSIAVIAAARAIATAREPFDATALLALAQFAVELNDVWIPASPGSAARWEQITRAKFLATRAVTARLLHNDDDVVATALRFKRLYCVARWVSGAHIGEIEKEANGLVYGDPQIGAGAVRQIASRVATVVGPLAKVLGLALPTHATRLRDAAISIYTRLEAGVSAEAAGLARLRLGLRRGEMLRLVELGQNNFAKLHEALKRSDAETVSLFGDKRATELLAKMDAFGAHADRRVSREMADQLRLFEDVAAIDVL